MLIRGVTACFFFEPAIQKPRSTTSSGFQFVFISALTHPSTESTSLPAVGGGRDHPDRKRDKGKVPDPITTRLCLLAPTQCTMRGWVHPLVVLMAAEVGTASDQQVIRSHQGALWASNIVADLGSALELEREARTSPRQGGEKTGGEFYAGADHFEWILGLNVNQHTFPFRSM